MSFVFKTWSFDSNTGQLDLSYVDSKYGEFTEQFFFPAFENQTLRESFQKRTSCIEKAIDQLFWMVGVSYYKTQLAVDIKFEDKLPAEDQAAWLTQTWQSGLAELAHQNQLPWLSQIQFPFKDKHAEQAAPKVSLKPRSLVAIGGGKDSLVSIDHLKQQGEDLCLFMVGNSEFIKTMASYTGCRLLQVKRRVDSRLKQANEAGAYNGHVPITAINSCVATVGALLYDFDAIVFSNERSADTGNVRADNGQWVNHQYSKSFEFEQTFQQLIHQHLAADLSCFSLLRPFSELAIVKKFSRLSYYFPHFSSCNRNFHLAGSQNTSGHWCGECPKCAFVYLMLAVFLKPEELYAVFGKDLLNDTQLIKLYAELLGVEGIKPFECVGETEESRWAFLQLSRQNHWQNRAVIRYFSDSMEQWPDIDETTLFSDSDQHLIPAIRSFQSILAE